MTFPVTFESIFGTIQASVATYRTRNGLPQLTGPDSVGSGTIAIGAEYLAQQLAPPCIIVTPRSEQFGPKDRSGVEDGGGTPPPTRYFTTTHFFEAWIWGDEDPNFAVTKNTTYSFDSTLELRRVFALALVQLGGVADLGSISGEWRHPQNDTRLGRAYVLTFGVKLGVDDDAPTYAPFATDSSSGVQVVATIYFGAPDGSSTQQMGVIVAPPDT